MIVDIAAIAVAFASMLAALDAAWDSDLSRVITHVSTTVWAVMYLLKE